MVNEFIEVCQICGLTIPQKGGVIVAIPESFAEVGADDCPRAARHLACNATGKPSVIAIEANGRRRIQNVNGRCEDAPCCGCCS